MRKYQKQIALDFIKTLYEAHENIRQNIIKGYISTSKAILEECQQGGIQLGNMIEGLEGEGCITVSYLEKYCEDIYRVFGTIGQEEIHNMIKRVHELDYTLFQVENSIKQDIKIRLEVVFLPYKASMWDSLESIWKKAAEDPECDAFVIPIPYYDRNPDFSFGEYHYEGNQFPDYVPIVHYNSYSFENHKPDIIFIHNPYDACNIVTSVEERFYSSELKKYTEMLVYVPYYLFPGKSSEHLIDVPGVFYADYIIAQNDTIKSDYVKVIQNETKEPKEIIEKRILALGSPKTDKIVHFSNSGTEISEEWKKEIAGRKVVFFNTNVSLILHNSENFITNMRRIFNIFKAHEDKFIVIWREHPLSKSTIKAMKPQMIDEYEKLKNEFVEKRLGILDKNNDAYMAMYVSDCYFGAGGSLVPLYSVMGKPIMITAYNFPDGISKKQISFEELILSSGLRTYYNEKNENSLELFLENLTELEALKEKRIALLSRCTNNLDGTVGEKIYRILKQNSI